MRNPLKPLFIDYREKTLKPLIDKALESVDTFLEVLSQAVEAWRVETLSPRTLKGLRDV